MKNRIINSCIIMCSKVKIQVILLATGLVFLSAPANAQGSLPRGAVAPDFTVTDMNGTQHHLYSDLAQGKYVLLKFGFIGCGTCMMAQRSTNWFYNNYGKGQCDVKVISIHSGDTYSDIQYYDNYLATTNPNLLLMGEELPQYPEIPDTYNPTTQEWASHSIFTGYAIQSVVAFVLIGPDSTVIFDSDFHNLQPISFWQAPFSYIQACEDTLGLFGYFYASDLVNHTDSELLAMNGCEPLLDGPAAVHTLTGNGQQVHVYPNPAEDFVTLRISGAANETADIIICDMLGREAMRLPAQQLRTGSDNRIRVETAALPPGMYHAVIRGTQTSGEVRFIRR